MVRRYNEKDLGRIIDIGNAAWREIYSMYHRCYGDELFGILMPDSENIKGRQIKEHASRHPENIFVCEEDSRIVGFITFNLDYQRKIATVGNNAVDPAYRHKGIGQQMYEVAFRHFREEGMFYAKVTTGLDEAHAPARRAYERAGFDIRCEDVTYYKKL